MELSTGPDLVAQPGDHRAAEGDDAEIRLLINNGKGVFADGTSRLPSQAFRTEEVLAGDMDGDGRMDLVAFDQDRLRLYLQDKAGKFTAANGNVPSIKLTNTTKSVVR